MAISMAMGFLFLGCGSRTFSTDDHAIAALLVALFPKLPHNSRDNRCHLQARSRTDIRPDTALLYLLLCPTYDTEMHSMLVVLYGAVAMIPC